MLFVDSVKQFTVRLRLLTYVQVKKSINKQNSLQFMNLILHFILVFKLNLSLNIYLRMNIDVKQVVNSVPKLV